MAADPKLRGVQACVFDAYGTVLNVAAAAMHCRDALGDKADKLAEIWRTKQLQYTWLRTVMGEYADFWKVTGDALDYSMATLGIKNKALRKRLMELYFRLDAYDEVHDMLVSLKKAGLKTAILSNGSPRMLQAAVKSAGITHLFDAVLSVDPLKVYKPDARVYRSAEKVLKVKASNACFLSSNAWDAWAAAHFGYRVVWVNRFGQQPERMPGKIVREIPSLSKLPALLGISKR